MKNILSMTLAVAAVLCMAAAHATDASDVASQLEDTHVDIRSLLDPNVAMVKSEPVAVALPDKPSIADKQLAALFKINLQAQGFTLATPDKAKWVLIATVRDQSTQMAYSEHHFFHPDYTPETGTVEFADVTVVVCPSGNLNDAAWNSTVRAYNDFWVTNQEVIIRAMLSTYGRNFYYRNIRPAKIPDASSQAPELEQIKACLANPGGKDCDDVLGQ